MKTISLTDLPDLRLWKPVYGRFDYTVVSRRLDVLDKCGIDRSALQAAHAFAEKAFADYQRQTSPRKYGFVFAIPTRITRSPETDLSEARHFLPLVDHLTPEVAQIFLSEMPPCILDEYYDNNQQVVGAIVFVPLFADMMKDIKPKFRTYLRARRIIRLSAQYMKDQLQPDLVGLGATLPKLTRFGKDIERIGLRTTTGHGGTVYLIYKMFNELQVQSTLGKEVGIIGAGSIGASTAALLLDQYPDIKIRLFDTRPAVLNSVVKTLNKNHPGQAFAAVSNDDVIQSSSIIISAITSTIRLSTGSDLSGKIIIDDSQPGSFSREDVEAHGGKIVWVVGTGLDKTYHRNSSFVFGDAGLRSVNDVWGCEAELASIWHTKSFNQVIDAPVTPELALRIGHLMDTVGITRAPWQMAGQDIDMKDVT